MPDHSLYGFSIKQICAVLQRATHAVSSISHGECQIHFGDFMLILHCFNPQPGQAGPLVAWSVVHLKNYLEEWVIARVAIQIQGRDQALKGQILMRIGFQHGLAHASQQLAESGIAGQIHSNRQHIKEHANQRLGFGITPPRNRDSHHYIILTAISRQQCLEGRQQCHVQRCAGAPADGGQDRLQLIFSLEH